MQVHISTYKVRFGSNTDEGRGDGDWFPEDIQEAITNKNF